MNADMTRAQPGELAETDEVTAEGLVKHPPAADWKVHSVIRVPDGWHVRGENLNWAPGRRGREFSWHVPGDPRKEPRYDLSTATWEDRTKAQR